ncbi:hypothetical protein J4Q44_G00132750 [Coregonus suidteri]|uniref:Uncharacterized protein n=1 Tax=Coregonus suidteri TaxID=861788 RepID=A0AAN8MAW1_9TELE
MEINKYGLNPSDVDKAIVKEQTEGSGCMCLHCVLMTHKSPLRTKLSGLTTNRDTRAHCAPTHTLQNKHNTHSQWNDKNICPICISMTLKRAEKAFRQRHHFL